MAEADIVIAASDATFFDPHAVGGQVASIEAIGPDPQDAHGGGDAHGRCRHGTSACRPSGPDELGMISQIVDPPSALRDEAQAWAEKIARNRRRPWLLTKRALWAPWSWA